MMMEESGDVATERERTLTSSLPCLICHKTIDYNPIAISTASPAITKPLQDLFNVFTQRMGWDLRDDKSEELEFDFTKDPFPFCNPCKMNYLLQVYELDDQIQELLKLLDGIAENVTATVLCSKNGTTTAAVEDVVQEEEEEDDDIQVVGTVSNVSSEDRPSKALERIHQDLKYCYIPILSCTASRSTKTTYGGETEEEVKPPLLEGYTVVSSASPPVIAVDDARQSHNFPVVSPQEASRAVKQIKFASHVLLQDIGPDVQSMLGPGTKNLICGGDTPRRSRSKNMLKKRRPDFHRSAPPVVTPQKGGQWKCKNCDRRYCSKQYLQHHQRMCSSPKGKLLVIKVAEDAYMCNSFPFKVEEGRFKCETQDCGYSAATKYVMKYHILKFHIDNKEPVIKFPCPKCNYNFSTKRFLKEHMLWHKNDQSSLHAKMMACVTRVKNNGSSKNPTGTIESPTAATHYNSYNCTYCGKVCRTKSHLETHLSKHVKVLRNLTTCEQCGKTVRKKALQQHMLLHTRQASKPKFSCKLCNKKFRSKEKLNLHMDKSHPGLTSIPLSDVDSADCEIITLNPEDCLPQTSRTAAGAGVVGHNPQRQPARAETPPPVLVPQVPIVAGTAGAPTLEELSYLCTKCKQNFAGRWILCDGCEQWYHFVCAGLMKPPPESDPWFCRPCMSKSN